jgi:hypothetical protein
MTQGWTVDTTGVVLPKGINSSVIVNVWSVAVR